MVRAILSMAFLALVGCGPKIYENIANPSAGEAELQRDYAMCSSYAEGRSPMPQLQQVPQTTTSYGSGTVMTNTGQYVPYTYTATTTPNPYQAMGAGMSNAAAQFAYIARIERLTEDCMASLGWKEAKKSSNTETDNSPKNYSSSKQFSLSMLPMTDAEIKACTVKAESGDIDAQKALGKLHYASDKAKGIAWYEKAASIGDSEALYLIGLHYWHVGDEEKAIEWLQKSSNLKNAEAMQLLASIYQDSSKNKNGKKSIELYTASGELGNIQSQIMMGFAYLLGENVKEDHTKAFQWFMRAAEAGDKVGQQQVGRAYIFGTGVPKNIEAAVPWLEKSAAQDDREAQHLLGIMYATGKGVPRDVSKGAQLLLKAASKNQKNALLAVSRIYETGMGLPQNHFLSYVCASLAVAQGENAAQKQKEKMANKIGPLKAVEAQGTIQSFMKASPDWKISILTGKM